LKKEKKFFLKEFKRKCFEKSEKNEKEKERRK